MGGEAKGVVTGRMGIRGEGSDEDEEARGRTWTAIILEVRGIVLFPGRRQSEQIDPLPSVPPNYF